MPKRHGISHALAVLISTLSAGLIISIVKPYVPSLANLFHSAACKVSEFIFLKAGVTIAPSVLSTVMLAAILAFLWGMAFAHLHKD